MARLIPIVLVTLLLGLAGVACGGDDNGDGSATTTTEETTAETTDGTTTDAGREVFVAECGSCHTLSDAGTSGTIGPSLDGVGLSEAEIVEQVPNGGGGMPAFEGQLSDEEIAQVAAYVADNG
jgi:mono/diheme cytochrome c family protein